MTQQFATAKDVLAAIPILQDDHMLLTYAKCDTPSQIFPDANHQPMKSSLIKHMGATVLQICQR